MRQAFSGRCEECLVHVGKLDDLDAHTDAQQDQLVGERVAGVERDGRLSGGGSLGASVAPGFAGREHQTHLGAVVREVLAELLHVGASDLARPAHEPDRGAEVGHAPPLAREIQRTVLAPLRDAHVAHAHLLEQVRAKVLEARRLQVRDPAPKRADHCPPPLRDELRGRHRTAERGLRAARLLGRRGGRRELDQRHPLAVDDEDGLAASLRPAPVVLEQGLHERSGIANQRLAEQVLLEQSVRQLGDRRPRLPLREPFEHHFGGRREAALTAFALVLVVRARLQRFHPPPRLRVDRLRLALARPVDHIAFLGRVERRRDRLDDLLGRHAPLEQRERPLRSDGHYLSLIVALRHRGETLPHRHLGILPDVAEQVLADGDLGDVLVMEGLAGAAQHFHRSFGERHVESLQLPAGLAEASLGPVEKTRHCKEFAPAVSTHVVCLT